MSNIQNLTQDRREKSNPYPLCFYSWSFSLWWLLPLQCPKKPSSGPQSLNWMLMVATNLGKWNSFRPYLFLISAQHKEIRKKIMISMHYLMNVFRFSIVKQLRDWWWHTSGWKWWAEASYCRRLRNCFQRTIHICLRRCTIHHRLGCRWKWICCHRWSLAQSSLNCR